MWAWLFQNKLKVYCSSIYQCDYPLHSHLLTALVILIIAGPSITRFSSVQNNMLTSALTARRHYMEAFIAWPWIVRKFTLDKKLLSIIPYSFGSQWGRSNYLSKKRCPKLWTVITNFELLRQKTWHPKQEYSDSTTNSQNAEGITSLDSAVEVLVKYEECPQDLVACGKRLAVSCVRPRKQHSEQAISPLCSCTDSLSVAQRPGV